jgi:hypothetical protein
VALVGCALVATFKYENAGRVSITCLSFYRMSLNQHLISSRPIFIYLFLPSFLLMFLLYFLFLPLFAGSFFFLSVCEYFLMYEIFELSSFTSTSYCETAHRSTPVFFGVLSLPYIHYYVCEYCFHWLRNWADFYAFRLIVLATTGNVQAYLMLPVIDHSDMQQCC